MKTINETSVQSIYSALRDHKAKLVGREYRVHGKEKHVCRVK